MNFKMPSYMSCARKQEVGKNTQSKKNKKKKTDNNTCHGDVREELPVVQTGDQLLNTADTLENT